MCKCACELPTHCWWVSLVSVKSNEPDLRSQDHRKEAAADGRTTLSVSVTGEPEPSRHTGSTEGTCAKDLFPGCQRGEPTRLVLALFLCPCSKRLLDTRWRHGTVGHRSGEPLTARTPYLGESEDYCAS